MQGASVARTGLARTGRTITGLTFTGLTALFCGLVQSAIAQESLPPWKVTVSTDSNYFSYRTGRAPNPPGPGIREHGSQFSQSLSAQLVGNPTQDLKLSFMVKGGAISSSNSNAGGSGSYSGLLDTTVSGTLTYLGIAGFQPFVSLNLNLPTGTSNNSNSGLQGKGDADLVPKPAFGEGLNIGPTIGVNIPINNAWMASVSGGYTVRGKFTREADIIPPFMFPISINPGDVGTMTTSLSWKGDALSIKGSLAYSFETDTSYNNQPFYRAGNRIIAQLSAGYAINDNWSTKAQVSYSHFARNKVLTFGLPPLVLEAFNSNNDVLKIGTDVTYARDNWSIGPTFSFTHRARNGWDPNTNQFITSRNSFTTGISGAYAVSDSVQIKARLERMWSIENSTPDKTIAGFLLPGSGTATARTQGWQASASASVKF